MSESEVYICTNCQVNEGHVFLCGEGLFCSECMVKFTGEEDEGMFFNDASVTDEVRAKAKQRIREERATRSTE